MKKFNPKKELNKVQYRDRNKLIGIIVFLLVIIAVGSTYALYQVRHTRSLVYTTVSDFKKRDIYLSVLVDGKTQGDFPKNNEGKIYSGIECDKEYSEAYFDNTEWKLHFTSDGPNKCTVKFETGNLPNAPELFQGMIPIVYGENGLMYVADTSKDWYNYQDHRWANAVLVDASNTTIKNKYFKEDNSLRDDIAGIQVPMEEVLQMYIWIPRYKYQLFNVDNGSVPKQLINIKFEKDTENTGDIKCTYENKNNGTIEEKCVQKGTENPTENGNWYTHPAFTFKGTTDETGTELKGIWIGKFESSDPSDPNGRTNGNNISEITILPGKTSLIYRNIAVSFNASRNIELQKSQKYNLDSSKIDTHMMKNIDWGAMAYLTQSVYGIYKDENTCNIDGTSFEQCEVWINNTAQGTGGSGTWGFGGSYTGCAGDSVSASTIWNTEEGVPAKCDVDKRWNTRGVNASTTGNMYGIYDLSGGVNEYIMGDLVDQTGEINFSSSGFSSSNKPKAKYYDMYTLDNNHFNYERGHLGDATREVIEKKNNYNGAWNNDGTGFPYVDDPSTLTNLDMSWFIRGAGQSSGSGAGIFNSSNLNGVGGWTRTFRVVLTAQDGED